MFVNAYLARPAAKSTPVGLRSVGVSYLFIFNDSLQTNYLKIYRIDLCQIFRVGRIMAVDDRPEISFTISQGTLLWQPSFDFVHRIDSLEADGWWRGRGGVNVGFCRASSSQLKHWHFC